MSVTLRSANASDAQALAELRWALRSSVRETHEGRAHFIGRCTTWMAERLSEGSQWRCWLALKEPEIVGCVWVQRVEKLPNPNGLPGENAYLSNFFVSEQ